METINIGNDYIVTKGVNKGLKIQVQKITSDNKCHALEGKSGKLFLIDCSALKKAEREGKTKQTVKTFFKEASIKQVKECSNCSCFISNWCKEVKETMKHSDSECSQECVSVYKGGKNCHLWSPTR